MGKKTIDSEDIDNAPPTQDVIEYPMHNIDDKAIEDIEEELTKQLSSGDNESKELFDNKNIRTKTDLSDDEIVYATKLRYMSIKYNLPIYDVILQEFMEMRLSRKRKSRGEYIESMKQKVRDMFGGLGGFNNGLNR